MNANKLARASQIFLAVLGALIVFRTGFITNIEPGRVGIRYNNVAGVLPEDLYPGYHLEIAGLQRVWHLPSSYLQLHFSDAEALSIRTKDNNTVRLDVSVPYRIIPGHAHKVLDAGNHLEQPDGRYRFERFANDTTISVLREELALLASQDFYDTDRRLQVARLALERLNAQLEPLELQASAVLIRGVYFRPEYEEQLARIQLNEQQKLLDQAKRAVADQRQLLDNYEQQTSALVSAREQEWLRRIAELDRAYQVGFIEINEDRSPGRARRALVALTPAEREALVARAAEVFDLEIAAVDDAHLLGIQNIRAETTEYAQRVRTSAEAVAARLTAEGEAEIARVRGAYERQLNALLNTPGGRAYAAYHAAENIDFADTLTFHSRDGIPSVLRLRDFAQEMMGR